MTENTLLPCPFCGGDAQFHTDNGPTGECYGWVGCNQCDAMSLHCDVRSMQPEDIHPIDAWNTRADSHHRLIEALRGLAGNAGALRAFEWEIREACGNTNWQCLMDAIAKADAALKETPDAQ